MNKLVGLGFIALIAIILSISSLFIVSEKEKALVLQFGEIKRVEETPGLNFKIPFIQNVIKYDDRILPMETAELEVTPLDDRRLNVDAFARWRIEDVAKFHRSTSGQGIPRAEDLLQRIINSELRAVLGNVTSEALLSEERTNLMSEIRNQAELKAKDDIGIDIIDVRIKRADLPQANLEKTYERMRAEREREAEDQRARGREAAQRIRATADRTVREVVSEADKNAEIIRGEADAKRNAIFAEAFGRDPEFFAFYRSLSAYEKSLKGDNSTMVIAPDSEFFEYLKTDTVQ